MASSNSSSVNALRRKPIMSVRHLIFVDLVTPSPPNSPIAKTPSVMTTPLSPSPLNAPSSMEESSHSKPSPPRETSSPFSPYSSSQPINPYIQDLPKIQGLQGEVSFLTTYLERLLNNYSRSTSSTPSTNISAIHVGRVICLSKAMYGEGNGVRDEAGYIVGMATCYPEPRSIKIANGEILTLESIHGYEKSYTGVMGLFYILVAERSIQLNDGVHFDF
nr:stress up-regulated Nod 19 protein [Tanacetum cinerariifolium]